MRCNYTHMNTANCTYSFQMLRLDHHLINESSSSALMVVEADETFPIVFFSLENKNINLYWVSRCLLNKVQSLNWWIDWVLCIKHLVQCSMIRYFILVLQHVLLDHTRTYIHFEIRSSLKSVEGTFERWKHPICGYNVQ